ncbi:hypothetical protein V6N13_001050 [Hibiscus sabdariffa]|uniref:Chitinase n=1 Tax=Hibiscus sabdariffa TaxID=183260 RepID=A0ABR2G782_9ROSI
MPASSLTDIIQQYNLDGIEHINVDPDTFAECIDQLIKTLKKNGVISFASMAPFDDTEVQSHYKALWKSFGDLIDYVNFQFYAYDKSIGLSITSTLKSLPIMSKGSRSTAPFNTCVEIIMQDASIVTGQGFGNVDPSINPAKFNLVDPVKRNTVMVCHQVGGWQQHWGAGMYVLN